jgi:1-deoxy-D-xylulose-5-phosphate reductoisomerase
MTFEPLDTDAFPSVGLARAAGRAGGTAPAVFAAANEEAVSGFLRGNLPFLGIVDTVERVLSDHVSSGTGWVPKPTLDDVLQAERWARVRAREVGRA